ncbi:MAG: tetratricopeptide repeat protein [Chloroflexota bacterium]
MSSLAIHLLGTFSLQIGEATHNVSLSRKTRAILVYIATTDIPRTRRELYTLFCAETDDPPGSLRWHLSRIRRQLSPDILDVDRENVRFLHENARVDAFAFAGLLDKKKLDDVPIDQLEAALNTYHGEFYVGDSLPDAPEFEMWLLAQRTRFQRLAQRGMTHLVERLIGDGRLQDALPWALRLLELDVLAETAHAQLMWLYARLRQRDAALMQYVSYRDLLERELAVEPSEEITRLYQEILDGEVVSSHITQSTQAVVLQSHAAPPGLVGRGTELAELAQVWHTAQVRGMAVALVEGEAGYGKTSLITEFLNQTEDILTLKARCYESTQARPYQPWLDPLETRLASVDDETLAQLSPVWQAPLTKLLPSLAARLGSKSADGSSGRVDESTLSLAVVEFLVRLPGTPSIALFVDDLQWADEASLRLFHFVARRVHELDNHSPLIMLGAYRAEEVNDDTAFLSFIHDLNRAATVTSLGLAPFDEQIIGELIDRHWPDNFPDNLDRAQLHRIVFESTRGNPLYVTELLEELSQMPELPDELPIPPSLSELVQRRLRQLPDSSRQVIEAMAVADIPTDVKVARRISGRSEDEVFYALDAGLRWRLLKDATGEMPGVFNFSHDLMRETVRQQLNTLRRQRLHQRTATTLAEVNAPAAQIAYHWQAAGDTEQELQYTVIAGERAINLYAYPEAIRYYRRVLELTDDAETRAHLQAQIGDSLSAIGDWTAAEAAYRKGLAIATIIHHTEAEATCRMGIGRVLSHQSYNEDALHWLEEAMALFRDNGNHTGQLQTLDLIALTYDRYGQTDLALQYYGMILDEATPTEHPLEVCKAHAGMGMVYCKTHQLDIAEEHLQQALDIADALNDPWQSAIALKFMGIVYRRRYDYARAQAYYAQHIQKNYDLNDVQSLKTGLVNMGVVCALQEFYTEAQACFQYALHLALEVGSMRTTATVMNNYGEILIRSGMLDEAGHFLTRSIAISRAIDMKYALCGALLTKAKRLYHAGACEQALAANDEGAALAHEIGRTDKIFEASYCDAVIRYQLGVLDAPKAVAVLENLLPEAPTRFDRGLLLHYIYRTEAARVEERDEAAAIFRETYEETLDSEAHRLYTELTGEKLQIRAESPALPAFLTRQSISHDDLLAQVDAIIADMQADQSLLPHS